MHPRVRVCVALVFGLVSLFGLMFPAEALNARESGDDPPAFGRGTPDGSGIEIGVIDPAKNDSPSTSNANYTYQPPPECGGEALEELRTASDRKELSAAQGKLSGDCVAPLGVWNAAGERL